MVLFKPSWQESSASSLTQNQQATVKVLLSFKQTHAGHPAPAADNSSLLPAIITALMISAVSEANTAENSPVLAKDQNSSTLHIQPWVKCTKSKIHIICTHALRLYQNTLPLISFCCCWWWCYWKKAFHRTRATKHYNKTILLKNKKIKMTCQGFKIF